MKPLTAFAKRTMARDGLQGRCRDCFRAWYLANPRPARVAIDKRRAVRRQEVLDSLWAYLSEHPCVDCGEDDIRVLDFDHLDASQKQRNVSEMTSGGWNWSTVLKEIEKCDVRCANCHRRVTAERAEQWRHVRWLVLAKEQAQQSHDRLRALFPHAQGGEPQPG
jgi:hypothetical protein